MISLQFLAGRMKPDPRRPGAERNDLVLNKAHLPDDIHGWTQSSFEAAKPADQLAEGQFWWTHAWAYEKSGYRPIVAFDQLGLHEWHELTVCYQAKGWRIDARTVESELHGGSSCDYVVARMSNSAGESAVLAFSVFWGDGQPMKAPQDPSVINFTGLEKDPDRGVWSRIVNRFMEPATSSAVHAGLENRALQCQVFLVSAAPLDQKWISDAVKLHLTTRQSFRDAWLLHATPRVTD